MEGLLKLGIDPKAILVYIVNIGLLTVILWYFLYNPIIGFLEKRQKSISDSIKEADNIKAELEQRLAEMEEERAKTQAELRAEVEKMEKFIDQRRAELTAEMEEEKNKLLTKANEAIDKRKAELIKEIEKDLLGTIKNIVLEIVHNKVPADVIQGSVSDAWDKYKK
jgi:F0F1-type ATP synthase membrane subunit b/b'